MNATRRNQLIGALMLVVAAFIWGFAFVAQRQGMDHIGPSTFNAVRSYVGVAALAPVVALSDIFAGRKPFRMAASHSRRSLYVGGLACGILLALASNLQQMGIVETSAGKSGFLTALYIVFVPIFGLFLGRRTHFLGWISVGIATVGMYLLCITEGFSLRTGDLLLLACALFYTAHILTVDHFVPSTDGIRLSCLQFAVNAVVSTLFAFLMETPELPGILAAWQPIIFTGVFSSGIAYTLQILAQKRCPPQIASLIMSLESVFAVIGGWLILNERLTLREGLGCLLVFGAILLIQLAPPAKEKKTA
ncbi:MAG: DMT family transporter [Clostridia bacterium]|nr:DMT family transporter [Clostridia bacterium]